jgi:hypothetical protein
LTETKGSQEEHVVLEDLRKSIEQVYIFPLNLNLQALQTAQTNGSLLTPKEFQLSMIKVQKSQGKQKVNGNFFSNVAFLVMGKLREAQKKDPSTKVLDSAEIAKIITEYLPKDLKVNISRYATLLAVSLVVATDSSTL